MGPDSSSSSPVWRHHDLFHGTRGLDIASAPIVKLRGSTSPPPPPRSSEARHSLHPYREARGLDTASTQSRSSGARHRLCPIAELGGSTSTLPLPRRLRSTPALAAAGSTSKPGWLQLPQPAPAPTSSGGSICGRLQLRFRPAPAPTVVGSSSSRLQLQQQLAPTPATAGFSPNFSRLALAGHHHHHSKHADCLQPGTSSMTFKRRAREGFPSRRQPQSLHVLGGYCWGDRPRIPYKDSDKVTTASYLSHQPAAYIKQAGFLQRGIPRFGPQRETRTLVNSRRPARCLYKAN